MGTRSGFKVYAETATGPLANVLEGMKHDLSARLANPASKMISHSLPAISLHHCIPSMLPSFFFLFAPPESAPGNDIGSGEIDLRNHHFVSSEHV